jgi:uncharacterized OB-fold protein
MPIRRGMLWKVCRKCGKKFKPIGRKRTLCPKCNPENKWIVDIVKRERR